MADPVFTAAHKVVIDAVGFVVAERVHHANRRVALDLLARALPHAAATGHAILDRIILAAVEVSMADQALTAREADCGATWVRAHLSASDAFAEFSLWRLSVSSERFSATLATDEVLE